MHSPRLIFPILLSVLPLSAQASVFRTDANHTVLGFKASTLLFDVQGRFDRFNVAVSGDPATLAGASVRIDVDARSVDTANKARDQHLRSEDFFDAAKFPHITFVSNQVRRDGDRVIVTGTLTLRGVSKELEIPFVAAEGRNGADVPTWSYRATVPLDRLAFGLGAESVAAKISLKKEVELDLLLVGSFEEPATPGAPARSKKHSH
jgi:polyisoprenoid-binding protein YceI